MIEKTSQDKKGASYMIPMIVIGVIVLIIVIWLISSYNGFVTLRNVLSGALRSLFAVSESYPELKANENFNKLQDQLQRLEEEIAGSRRYYNGVVNRYNTKTELFPGNIIAGIFGFKRKPLFEVSNESERENVQVKF